MQKYTILVNGYLLLLIRVCSRLKAVRIALLPKTSEPQDGKRQVKL